MYVHVVRVALAGAAALALAACSPDALRKVEVVQHLVGRDRKSVV